MLLLALVLGRSLSLCFAYSLTPRMALEVVWSGQISSCPRVLTLSLYAPWPLTAWPGVSQLGYLVSHPWVVTLDIQCVTHYKC